MNNPEQHNQNNSTDGGESEWDSVKEIPFSEQEIKSINITGSEAFNGDARVVSIPNERGGGAMLFGKTGRGEKLENGLFLNAEAVRILISGCLEAEQTDTNTVSFIKAEDRTAVDQAEIISQLVGQVLLEENDNFRGQQAKTISLQGESKPSGAIMLGENRGNITDGDYINVDVVKNVLENYLIGTKEPELVVAVIPPIGVTESVKTEDEKSEDEKGGKGGWLKGWLKRRAVGQHPKNLEPIPDDIIQDARNEMVGEGIKLEEYISPEEQTEEVKEAVNRRKGKVLITIAMALLLSTLISSGTPVGEQRAVAKDNIPGIERVEDITQPEKSLPPVKELEKVPPSVENTQPEEALPSIEKNAPDESIEFGEEAHEHSLSTGDVIKFSEGSEVPYYEASDETGRRGIGGGEVEDGPNSRNISEAMVDYFAYWVGGKCVSVVRDKGVSAEEQRKVVAENLGVNTEDVKTMVHFSEDGVAIGWTELGTVSDNCEIAVPFENQNNQ